MQSAWKVGLMVVLFGVLLLASYALLQRSMFAEETIEYYVEFEDAGGLSVGARVLLSGVQIGSVTRVELVRPGQARATLAVGKRYEIPEGVTAVLPTPFISIGDRQIQLIVPSDSTGVLSAGAVIPGTVFSPMETILPDSNKTLEELNRTLVALRGLLEDDELKAGLYGMISASEESITSFGNLANRMDGILARNAGKFDELLATTARSLLNLEALSLEVRELAESGLLQDKAVLLLDNLNEAVLAGKELIASLDVLATNPELTAAIMETAANVRSISDSGTRIAVSAELIAENGVIVSDEAIKLARKANELADEVGELLDSLKAAIERFQIGGTAFTEGLEVSTDLTRELSHGRFRADVNVTLPVGETKVTFGLYDAFESNKLNLQLHNQLTNRLDLRYGVYASKPGVGVDYALAPRLAFRGDLFDLNDTQLDLRLRYQFTNTIHGWFGIERLLRRSSPSIGVGIKQ
ncbi:MAG: MCE family protein [Armatimonadetes bacterium]|nr:MCE family protein [Armatimonadota bacterium]